MSLARDVAEAPDGEAVSRVVRESAPGERAAAVEELANEVLRQLRVDVNRAVALAERAELLAEISPDPAAGARACWVKGHTLAARLQAREALECYRRAVDRYVALGRAADAARVGIGEVNALTYLGRYAEALAAGERARRALLRTGQPDAAARLDMNLANVDHRMERHSRALSRYDRALRSARARGDHVMIRLARLNRATALSALGRLDRAESEYVAVRAEAKRAGETRVRAFADFNLGYVLYQRGEFGRAYDTLDEARRSFEETQDAHYLTLTLIDLAELLLEVRCFERAATIAARARALASSLGLGFERARATLFEAVAAAGRGDPATAATRVEEARAGFREEGNRVSEAVCDVRLAEFATGSADAAAAVPSLRRAVRVFHRERMRLHEATARLVLAAALDASSRRRDAAAELDRALACLRRLPAPWLSARERHLRGRLAEAAGDRRRAARHYREALRRVESLRGRIGIDEFGVSFARGHERMYADLLALVMEAGRPSAAADALALIERSRSRALVDLLARRLDAVAAHDPVASRLLRRLQDLRRRLNGAPHSRRTPSDLRQLDPVVARRVEEDITENLRRVERRNAALGALTAGETMTLSEVRARIPRDAQLVEYWIGPRGSWAVVVSEDRARAVRLPVTAAELQDRLARLRFQIEKAAHGEEYLRRHGAVMQEGTQHHLSELAERVWRPLEVSAPRVILVPHGPLHSLPFAALPTSRGERVVDRHSISVLPSATCLRYLGRASRPEGEPRVVVVEAGDEGIPATRRETRAVRSRFPRGPTFRGARATAARLRRAAPMADILHIATHGLFRGDDPTFSAFQLADGWMSLHDVYGLRLKDTLVCLSACQSGRNWIGPGDEIVGLARGFVHAGASSLLLSLWAVHDESAADLVTAFYGEVRAGRRLDEALAEAMRVVRAKRPFPFHWAPFVLVGGAATSFRPAPTRSRGSPLVSPGDGHVS